MADYAHIDSKRSWWTWTGPERFTDHVVRHELDRMLTSPFSRIRFDLDGELAPPKRKGKTGRAYEEAA